MRKTTTLICTLFIAMTTWAGPITRTAALKKANAFLKEKDKRVVAEVHRAPGVAAEEDSPYYIFNVQDSQGFVIVSGDDRTVPILGYTEVGSFDAENVPDNVRWWLQGYANQIASLGGTQTLDEDSNVHKYHEAIPKLLEAEWDQTKPFNDQCPVMNGDTCVTGCVATAMSQIMYYYKYPAKTTANIPSYTYEVDGKRIKVDALSASTFDWDNMKTNYSLSYTAAEGAAVAKLMTCCGRSIGMGYTPNLSSGNDTKMVNAIVKYFGYDKSAVRLSRDSYTDYEWQELILNELDNSRPVYYAGATDAGSGHAFVCDGYDGAGKYHINWGWGGRYDGFYALSVLDPEGRGTGGGMGTTGYAYDQNIIINIKPNAGGKTSDLYLSPHKSSSGEYLSISGTKVTMDFWNASGWDGDFNYGYEVISEDGTRRVEREDKVNLTSSYYITNVLDLKTLFLPNGTYQVRPVSKSVSATDYHTMLSREYYLEVTVNKGYITVEFVREDVAENEDLVDVPESVEPELDVAHLSDDDSHLYCGGIAVDKEAKTVTWKMINISEVNTSYDFAMGLLMDDGSLRPVLGYSWSFSKINFGASYVFRNFDLSALTAGPYKLVPISKVSGTSEWKNDMPDENFVYYDPANDILEILDTEPTGIREITKAAADDDDYYTLGGVRVEKPLQKGFYIRGGKKLLVK